MKRWMWWALAAGVGLAIANRYVVEHGGKPFVPAWLDFSSPTVGGATRASVSAQVPSPLADVGDPGTEVSDA